ncbi:MAG: hypothetical protein QM702_21110 [Rubrivivax sp.]
MARSLHHLAVLPLFAILAACASEAEPIPDGATDAPEIVGDKSGGDKGSSGASGASSGGGGSGSLEACLAQPACDGQKGPTLGDKRAFTHSLSNVYSLATAYHRGRDMIYGAGDAQWIVGKFTYSLVDKDLEDEEIDVFVERGCAGSWEKLGTTRTTSSSTHATVEGVADSGGRVYFQIPSAKALAPGRHRIRMVVAGDHTSADLLVDVVPKGAKIVVSDVDGTLTSSETAEYPALLTGSLPDPQPHAADVLSTLAGKGYHVVYVTARPEWLTLRTHEFLAKNGFPPGIVHTTTGTTGALGGAAASFKSEELTRLASHGLTIAWAFGNQPSDTDAYEAAKIEPRDHRVFLRVDDSHGGRRIEAYSEILPVAAKEAALCK